MNKNEKIGQLTEWVCLQKRVLSENKYSEKEEVWEKVKDICAEVEYSNTKSGEDMTTGRVQTANNTAVFRVWQDDCITVLHRLVWGTEIWNIKVIRKEGGGQFRNFSFLECEKVE